jgi:hypothetical protein
MVAAHYRAYHVYNFLNYNYMLNKIIILVYFVLLQQNATNWVIYNEKKFIGSWFWRLGRLQPRCQHLVRAFLVRHTMVDGER